MTHPAKKSLLAVWRDAVADSDLTAAEKGVVHAISTYMNKNGHAYPGRKAIARRSSLSTRTVDKAIKRIERAGFLKVERVSGGNGKTNSYQAFLSETTSDLRCIEWETANLTTRTANLAAPNSEQRSPESSECELKQQQLLWIEETCEACGEPGPCVDDGSRVLCRVCREVVKRDPREESAPEGWGASTVGAEP
jgi:DNA-binding MarR family transcriptional regulator